MKTKTKYKVTAKAYQHILTQRIQELFISCGIDQNRVLFDRQVTVIGSDGMNRTIR